MNIVELIARIHRMLRIAKESRMHCINEGAFRDLAVEVLGVPEARMAHILISRGGERIYELRIELSEGRYLAAGFSPCIKYVKLVFIDGYSQCELKIYGDG